MQNRHYPPAYLRYLKARLQNIRRPSFWGTATVLLVFGLGIWQYLSNPDVFARKPQPEEASPKIADSSLSSEEQAVVADIDNFPVLMKDYEQANLAATLNIPPEKSPAQNSQSLFEDVISKQPSATNDAKANLESGIVNGTPASRDNNPFVVQTDNLLQMKSGYGDSHLLDAKSLTAPSEQTASAITPFSPGMGLANQTDKIPNSVTISPLQAAINQSPNQNLSGYNNTTSNPTNIMGTASYNNATSPNQNLSGYNNTTSNPTNIMGTASYNNATSPNQNLSGYNNTTSNPTSIMGAASYNNATLTPASNGIPSQTLPANTSLSTGTGYTQPTATNLPQNPYTNFNNSQTLPNGIQTTSVTPSVTSAATTNFSPYSTPNQVPNVVNYSTPSVYSNYSVQQSKLSLPRPTPGTYGGVQINGYKYP